MKIQLYSESTNWLCECVDACAFCMLKSKPPRMLNVCELLSCVKMMQVWNHRYFCSELVSHILAKL